MVDAQGAYATVLVSTPMAALRLAAGAPADLARKRPCLVFTTGESGGSIDVIRRDIQHAFGGRCVDIYARRQTGVVGSSCSQRAGGIHLNESRFELDVWQLETDTPCADGELGQLVINGQPTGDLVRLSHGECVCGSSRTWAIDGVLGRRDELVSVRGHRLLPSDFERVILRHPGVADFRLRLYTSGQENEVAVLIEADAAMASESDRARVEAEISEELKRSLGLRLQCEIVPPPPTRSGARAARVPITGS